MAAPRCINDKHRRAFSAYGAIPERRIFVDGAHQRALGAYGAIPARMGRSMGVRFSTGLVANIDRTTTCRTWPHIWRTWLALLA